VSRKDILIGVLVVSLIATGGLSFFAGLQQGFTDAQLITVTSTVTLTVTNKTISSVNHYPPTSASAFVVFIDNTPQLRIAWALPLTRGDTIDNFTLLDASNKSLISFTKFQVGDDFATPYPEGMPIGFSALSHSIAVGDSVTIVIVGKSGGVEIKVVYPTVIQVCDPNRTWC